jgi:hypothetical protein
MLRHLMFVGLAVSVVTGVYAADVEMDRAVYTAEIDASVESVWAAFTTEKGIESWMAPVAEIELVEEALEAPGLMVAHRSRPPYQQNDDLIWINRAKRATTKEKRRLQMLEELERGDRDMKMPYRPKEG